MKCGAIPPSQDPATPVPYPPVSPEGDPKACDTQTRSRSGPEVEAPAALGRGG